MSVRAACWGRRGLSGRRRGTTLAELIVTMGLLAIVATIGARGVGRALDRVSVQVARDGLASQFAEARALAVARGSAAVVVDPAAERSEIESPLGQSTGRLLSYTDGIDLQVVGSLGPVSIEFDSRGVGVFAGRTFRLVRGAAEAGLTLSSYGRPRRW